MKVVVLGGNGFIGANLVTALLKEGSHVTVVDRSKPKFDVLHEDVQYYLTGLNELLPWAEILENADFVIHLASDGGVTWTRYSKESM